MDLNNVINKEIIRVIVSKIKVLGYSDYYIYHNTMCDYFKLNNYSLFNNLLEKLGKELYHTLHVTFGYNHMEVIGVLKLLFTKKLK